MRHALLFVLILSHTLLASTAHRLSFTSEHFIIGIDREKAHRADSLLALCEKIYADLSQHFGHRIDERIRVIVFDEEDYANGYAVGFKPWMGIYLPPSAFRLRGAHRWEHDVIAHEMAHLFSLRKLGYTSSFLGVSAGVVRQGETGLARGVVTYYRNGLESWLVEGLAQLGSELCGYDSWDARRAMLERVAFLSGNLLTLDQVRTYFGDARQSEQVYNQGYSFMRFVYRRTGPKGFVRLLDKGRRAGLKRAIEEAFEAPFPEVFAQWRDEVAKRYAAFAGSEPGSEAGYVICASPLLTENASYHISSERNDYGMTALYQTLPDGRRRLVAPRVARMPRPSSKTGKVYYLQDNVFPDGNSRSCLYELDERSLSARPILRGERIYDVADCRGKRYLLYRDSGFVRLGVVEKGRIRQVAPLHERLELTGIVARDSVLIVSAIRDHGNDIYVFDPRLGSLDVLMDGPADERDPQPVSGGIIYSCDESGVYQIYFKGDGEGSSRRLTGVVGGAFEPFLHADSLFFSSYETTGFVLRGRPFSAPAAPTPTLAPVDSSLREADIPAVGTSKTHVNANGIGVLGYALGMTYMDAPRTDSASLGLGRKAGGYVAGYFSDPAFENMVSVFASLAKDIEQGRDFLDDREIMVNYTTASFIPTLSFTGYYGAVTPVLPDSAANSIADSLGDPSYVTMAAQASILQPLSSRWYCGASASIIDLGVAFPSYGGMQSLTVLKSRTAGGFLAYQYIEPGVDVINRGIVAALQGELGVTEILDSISPEASGYVGAPSYAKGELYAALYGNIGRRLFGTLEGNAQKVTAGGMIYSLGIGGEVPLRWKPIGVPFPGSRLSLLGAMPYVKYSLTNVEEYGSEVTASALRRPRFSTPWIRSLRHRSRALFDDPFGSDRVNLDRIDIGFMIKTVGLFNTLSWWQFGAAFSSGDPSGSMRWLVAVSL